MNRHHRPGESARARQKTAQLCRQVYRTLVAAIADLDEDVLLDVNVESVQPWPDATRLLVVLRAAAAAVAAALHTGPGGPDIHSNVRTNIAIDSAGVDAGAPGDVAGPDDTAQARHADRVQAAVERHRGRLRAEVARAVTRKRAPELAFRVIVEPHERCLAEGSP